MNVDPTVTLSSILKITNTRTSVQFDGNLQDLKLLLLQNFLPQGGPWLGNGKPIVAIFNFNSMKLKFNAIKFKFNSMKFNFNSKKFKFNSMKFNFNSMKFKFNSMKFNFNSMKIQVQFHENSSSIR